MKKVQTNAPTPKQGQIWWVRFSGEGKEIRKIRPAVVVRVKNSGDTTMTIIVPLTGWKNSYKECLWIIRIEPDGLNGLDKISGADTSQITAASFGRFQKIIGDLSKPYLENVIDGILLCVGHVCPGSDS